MAAVAPSSQNVYELAFCCVVDVACCSDGPFFRCSKFVEKGVKILGMLDNSGTERDESEGRMAFPKSFVKVVDALEFVGHCHV